MEDQPIDELLGSEVNCGVCNKIMIKQCAQNPGEEAVFCEGQCKTWLHRHCAGLTVSMFANMDASTPFLCIYCAFSKQPKEVD